MAKSAIRVLHVIPTLTGGGAERQLSYLVPWLQRLDVDVHVAYLRDGPNLPRLLQFGIPCHKLEARSNYDPSILVRLLRLMERIKPDLLHSWLLLMDLVGGCAARIQGCPWLMTERSSALAYAAGWKSRLREQAAHFSTAIVANSAGGAEYWARKLPRKQVQVIGNIVPLEEIRAAVPVPTQLDRPLIVAAGRLIDAKNPLVLLEALDLALGELGRGTAVLYGVGPLLAQLEQRRRKLAHGERITLGGYVDNLWNWFNAADVFVSVSRYEGLPNAALEAMACGCSLVLSDIPAHRELLVDPAAFVRPESPVDIARALVIASSHADDGDRSAQRYAAMLEQRDGEHVASLYVDLYSELIARRYGRRELAIHQPPARCER